MPVSHSSSARAIGNGARSLLVLGSLLLSLLPLEGLGQSAETDAALSAAALHPQPALAAERLPLAGQALPTGSLEIPRLAPPSPLSLGGSVAGNWSPYAPSAFTWDYLDFVMRTDSVAIGTLPNVATTQAGNVTLSLNGTWNPAPATSTDRDWVTLIAVFNGRATLRTLESNTSVRIVLNASQVPARFFFAMPSPVNFSGAVSSAQIQASLPGANATRLNLTAAASGLNVTGMKAVAPIASQSVWFNGSGTYTPGGYLNGTQNITVVAPLNGLPAFEVAGGQVAQWAGPGPFPGARLFLLINTTNNQNFGTRVTLWTRGSPESGLYLNASAAPANVSRGADLNISGAVGSRSLTASTNWSVNTTPVLAPNHFRENCTNVIRLQNGSWRLFCNFRSVGANNTTTDGVDSAFSADGVSWAWEPGVRYELCGGALEIDQVTVYRLLDGRLRMYYTGRNPPSCNDLPATHIESALSADEGYTWTLEGQYGDLNATVVVPTVDGGMRFYILNGSSLWSFVIDGVTGWFDGPNITANMPRTVYLLSDGTYKMYFGTTAVYSATSPNGLNWSAPQLEVAKWSGDIEAGPLLDPGDGSLTMLLYSQTSGLYLARLGAANASAWVTVSGRTSGGSTLGTVLLTASGAGSFQTNVTVPADAPLGRYRLAVGAWFGNASLKGLVLNRPPVWSGPAAVTATEDIPLALNLANWTLESDTADTVALSAASAYGVLSGSNLTLLYPQGVLSDVVFGNLSDGFDITPFRVDIIVTPVNDLPLLSLDPFYYVTEDQQGVLDLTGRYSDEETPTALLNLSTDLSGAQVQSPLILVSLSTSGTFGFTVSVSDGANVVSQAAQIVADPVDDAPTLTLDPTYTFTEDQPGAIDLTGRFGDEETATSLLVLATNLTGATVASPRIFVDTSQPSASDAYVTVSDGNHTVSAATRVIVTAVDDPPVIGVLPTYTVEEDATITIDIGAFVTDEDTGLSGLSLTTTLPGAVVNGLTITVALSDPRAWYFEVTVSDGTSTASRQAEIDVTPVNDAPRWTAVPDLSQVTEGQLFRVDLALYADDIDNSALDIVFTALSSYATINGTFLELLYPNGVSTDSIVLRVSDGLLFDEQVLSVNVRPFNNPPVLLGDPPVDVAPGTSRTFVFSGTDLETPGSLTFALTTNVSWITLSPEGVLLISPPPSAKGRFAYDVLLHDGEGGFDSRSFAVGVDNGAPVISDFPRNATPNVLYTAHIPVEDPDGDAVTVTLVTDTTGVEYDPASGVISWFPAFAYPPGSGFNLAVNLTIIASDGIATTTMKTAIIVRDPPDRPPFITGNFDDIRGYPGETFTLNLWERASDTDDPVSNLTWRIVGDIQAAVALWDYTPSTGVLRVILRGPGHGNLTVILSDQSGLTDAQTIRVETLAPAANAPFTLAGVPWWALLLLAGAAGAGLVYARRRSAPSAAAAQAAPAAQVPLLAAPGERAKYLVEDVFLLTLDGRLLYTRGGLSADAHEDPDVLGSMLVAVQEFAKDAFRSGSPVSRMSYGDNTVLLERGSSVILAVTVFGEPGTALKELMADVVGRAERTFAGVIERWDGDRLKLAGLEDLLTPLWLGSSKLTRDDVLAATRGAEVQMLSAVEFFQGYVRVKVGIVNNSPSIINAATIDLDYNSDVLRLVKIEPATYRSAGARVIVGTVPRGEKLAIAYYLDPQICTTSAIDGTCVYKDLSGRQHAIEMKSRKAEIVCPLFFTKEQANSALLKRLIETQLNQYDARGYTFKAGAREAELRGLFETMKSAVLAHDVQLVRTFERRRPYGAEAWFYGRTQVKGYQMVIRAAVNETKGRAEFFVASTVLPPITGLLAELHHTFKQTVAGKLAGFGVQPLFDENLRHEYTNRAAVSRMVEGEADAGDTEAP